VYEPDGRFWRSTAFVATPLILVAIALLVWSVFGFYPKLEKGYPFYPLSGGVSFILGFFALVPERVLTFLISSLTRLFPG
jgi:hypothetical protein